MPSDDLACTGITCLPSGRANRKENVPSVLKLIGEPATVTLASGSVAPYRINSVLTANQNFRLSSSFFLTGLIPIEEIPPEANRLFCNSNQGFFILTGEPPRPTAVA